MWCVKEISLLFGWHRISILNWPDLSELTPLTLVYQFANLSSELERNGNFEEVLELVVKNDKQRFEDTVFASIGKENHVITKPILLKNGNQIVEEYNFLYHDGDYEYRSPLLLQGHTKLIAINK